MQRQHLQRQEDVRLLTGAGRYAADCLGGNTLFAGFLRADVASARITAMHVPEFSSDVLAVHTADDLRRAGVGPMLHDPLPRDDGGPPGTFPMPLLAGPEIHHIGEPIAMIVARSRAAVDDAIEQIELEIEECAAFEGIALCRIIGDRVTTTGILASATHTIHMPVHMPRATAAALEPRGGVATPGPDGTLLYTASTQNPFAMRDQLCAHFGWRRDDVRVTAADVGGSFGLKGFMAREDALLCWAAMQLQTEIAWLPTRSETMLADSQGRGVSGWIKLAIDDDLAILALDADFEVDAGAYPSRRAMGLIGNVGGLTGMYRIAAASAAITGHLSAKVPLAPFRGNGRPEATFAIECALDHAARQIGCDPVELRQRNLIAAQDLPNETAFGLNIDCGDFPRVVDTALRFRAGAKGRRADASRRGMLFGIGLANCVEAAGGPIRGPKTDHARLTIGPGMTVTLATGVMSSGQGHETAMSQLVADELQIDLNTVDYVNGDTSALVHGRGSGGSSGLTVAGSAVRVAIDRVLDDGRLAAADQLGCEPHDLTYRDGSFVRAGSNLGVSLKNLAAAQPDGRWVIDADFTPPAATFPNGSHVCEVEIDPETGQVTVTRYGAVEDIGRVLNPTLVAGQLHGGIAQGLSQGLGETIVFDDHGQILSGSFMDYRMPRATDIPMMQIATVEVPTQLNPLGVKGVGEAGTVGATAAFASAISAALADAGIAEFRPPATPLRIWQALRDAGHPSAS